MELIPIPYFGMLLSLFVAPTITFAFILLMKKMRTDVDKLKYKKEILELEIQKEELRMKRIGEENRKYDAVLEAGIEKAIDDALPDR